jgi:glutamate N-acetyltransferase/amino-acid N-acetyltransferase
MATTLGYIFTDADIPNNVLKKLLKKNISNTFNAISCDSDTSTNDMVSIFSTGKSKHSKIQSINDEKIREFDVSLNRVLLNLAKRVVADGEGASKFITIDIQSCKNENDAKKIGFSIANSPLVKTAIAGEDPNWGRIVMAIGKAGVQINYEKLSIKFGNISVVHNGKLNSNYNEEEVSEYMKSDSIDINVDISSGSKGFKVYTMDLTKKYIEINGDYRS